MKSLLTVLFASCLVGQLSAQWLGGEQPAGHDLIHPEEFYKLHPALRTPSLIQPDSVSYYEYDESQREWLAHQAARFQYDSRGRLIQITYFQEMGKWIPYRRTEIRYNVGNQITRLSFFVESNRDFLETERHEYQYFERGEISSRRHWKRDKNLQLQLVSADSLAFDLRDSLPTALEHLIWRNGSWKAQQRLDQITYQTRTGLPKKFTYTAFDTLQNRWSSWQEFEVLHWRLGFRNWTHWLDIPQPERLLFQDQGTESPYHYRPTDFSVRSMNEATGKAELRFRMQSELRNGQISSLKRFVFEGDRWHADQDIRMSWHASHLVDSILALPMRPKAAPRQLIRFDYDAQLHPTRFESREEKQHGRLSRRHFAYSNQYDGLGRPNLFETSYIDSNGTSHFVTRQEYHYDMRTYLPPASAFAIQLGSTQIQDQLRLRTNQSGQYECIQIVDAHGQLAWHWEPKLPARKELELELSQLAPGPYGIFVTIGGQQAHTTFVKR